jgi:hypothetical protein
MNIFKLIFNDTWALIKPWVYSFISQANKTLIEATSKAVLTVAESYVLTGDDLIDDRERRELAFKQIEQDLKMQGILIGVDIARSIIWDAIQIAVSRAKTNG